MPSGGMSMLPRLFLYRTIIGRCCLEFIIGGLLGWYAKNLAKICFFRQSHAIMRLMRGFGVKNRSFVGFSPGKGDPKTIF